MIRRRSLRDQHRLIEREQKNLQILDLIRQRGPLTRTELSQGVGFNIVTVSNYINQFIQQGLVSELGFDVSSGGRKPVLVELNAKAGYVVGIDLGPMDLTKSHTIAVITDLKGHIVHRLLKPRTTDRMDHVIDGAEEVIRELIDTSPVDPKKIQGIGIGLPGIMDESAGTVRDTSAEGIRTNYVAARDHWEETFKLPVLVGNDATLAGYGEFRLGLDRQIDNAIYLYSDVGASLMIHGHIYWGSGGSAGEIGLAIFSEEDYVGWVKSPSFVLPNVWDMRVAAQAKKLAAEQHALAIRDLAHGDLDTITLETVLEAAQQGDAVAQELIEDAAMRLGIRIAYYVNFLNPDVVIIGGGIERAGSLLLEPIWRAVKRYAYEEPANHVDVLPAQLGENAVVLGAACWLIREFFIQA